MHCPRLWVRATSSPRALVRLGKGGQTPCRVTWSHVALLAVARERGLQEPSSLGAQEQLRADADVIERSTQSIRTAGSTQVLPDLDRRIRDSPLDGFATCELPV